MRGPRGTDAGQAALDSRLRGNERIEIVPAMKTRTKVGIVGAGPAGLMLSHLLHLDGIESVILEDRSRDYIESRIRAGLIEHWATDLLIDTGVGERLKREA